MQLGSMFIWNCNIAVHVSDAFCVHLQEHLETVVAASGDMRRVEVSNKASKVDGIHTKSYCVVHSRTAPEDGRKKRPKHVEQYCSSK